MIKELLREYDLEPDTFQGQHFLDAERILEQEVDEAEVDDTDTVLEVGTGLGTLTKKIAERAGTVYTVEKDKRIVRKLRDILQGYDNIELVQGDVLDIELPAFDTCVSNPPYHISSELIELLGENKALSVLTLQQAFAQRLVAAPGSGDYSRLTVMTNYHFIPVYIQDISADYFYPRPDVDSALVKLYPREKQFGIDDSERFFTLVAALFTNKRKKTRNAFVDGRHILDIDKDHAKGLRDDLPHSEERVINLEMKQLAETSAFLEDKL
jgi:16S rRNA (adenine1518-N6/adenine1519-N6)-dimethyltransferase